MLESSFLGFGTKMACLNHPIGAKGYQSTSDTGSLWYTYGRSFLFDLIFKNLDSCKEDFWFFIFIFYYLKKIIPF